ncbi:N-acetyltransferase ESCO2-like isoform X2 [Paramacrobiotus metropolitanus]|uniref:N-acetyltransferase ESCO2-like isoform X2 n=1 Tax=Paramacrobiotus metropolitanus TaxID=2943436 RepID=UPI002446359C|nr:N-acetyltransferase ESCO2-like isoform X2 [Paramacrobiotus metropolitanus]
MDNGHGNHATSTPRTLRNVTNKSSQMKLTDFSCVNYVPNLRKMVGDSVSAGDFRVMPQSAGKKRQKMEQSTNSAQKRYYQPVIDANQREIGARLCKMCGFVGDLDDEEDRRIHDIQHGRVQNGRIDGDQALKYTEFKNEVLLRCGMYGYKVVLIKTSSGNSLVNKARSVVRLVSLTMDGILVERLEDKRDMVVLLVDVRRRFVVGCVCADVVAADPERCSSFSPEPDRERILCGVDLIWIDAQHRRKGLASLLLDALWDHFADTHLGVGASSALTTDLKKSHLAFSEPTENGRRFIVAFIGAEDFLLCNPRKRRHLE